MHYTQWDRGNNDTPRLLADAGPLELAVFDTNSSTAQVGEETWKLEVDKTLGASATLEDGTTYRAAGNLARDKKLDVSLDGHSFTLFNEDLSDWIVEDATGEKVAQFSGRSHGVRKSILEFEEGVELPTNHIVALSWFARLTLESRIAKSNNALIITLVLLTIVAILVWVL